MLFKIILDTRFSDPPLRIQPPPTMQPPPTNMKFHDPPLLNFLKNFQPPPIRRGGCTPWGLWVTKPKWYIIHILHKCCVYYILLITYSIETHNLLLFDLLNPNLQIESFYLFQYFFGRVINKIYFFNALQGSWLT